MFKNATPKQIAIYSALLISFFTSVLLVFGIIFHFLELKWFVLIIYAFCAFILSYYVVIRILNRFIYRKIKLIYKSIHNFKRAPKDGVQTLDLNKDIMKEVEQEVKVWADSQQKEIETLRSEEIYRREFLGNISHELKTPIFSIQGYIHTLLEGGLFDEKINKKYLERAASNVDRLNTILEDLESISRLESGKSILEIRKFDIRELAQQVFEDHEVLAKEKEIELLFKQGADQGFYVKADIENIRQVLVNLVTNSIKYGKNGGYTKISFYDMEKYILIEVADNGIGVGKEDLSRLFDRFYRADKSRSRDQGGSGLGLSIVKHIIEAHQQTINVRSTPGRGSTFGFTLEKAN